MSAEDEDLMALRSAALASLSTKPEKQQQPEEEEDLEALRLAALMTRKANQKIQVIHQPLIPKMHPPPMFWNHWNTRTTANLISLTPDPNLAKPPPVRVPPKRIPNKPQRTSVPAEPKVPDKFSRYNSDSSSEDEEDNPGKQRPVESDGEAVQSDAESVKSEKSFSSVSEAEKEEQEAEVSDKEEQKEEETKERERESGSERTHQSDDNISIIDDEEDDILAQIDDYLEDRPKKDKVKKGKKKVKVDQENQMKRKDGKKELNKTPECGMEEKVKASSDVKSSRKRTEEKTSETQNPTKISGQSKDNSFKRKPDKSSETMSAKGEKPIPTIIKSERRDNAAKMYPNKSLNERLAKRPNEQRTRPPARKGGQQRIPVLARNVPLPPGSPPRERRDSDLDSVGTSDLSFLASDSDEERKMMTKQNEKKRVKPLYGNDTRETQSRKKVSSRPESNAHRRTGKADPGRDNNRTRENNHKKIEKPEQNVNKDLRKKLETKGLKKRPMEAATKGSAKDDYKVRIQSNQAPRNKEPSVGKSRILNLKKKISRIPEKPRSRSRSKEKSSTQGSLPELNEARRIIITRPNPSATPSNTSNDSNSRSDSTKQNAKNRIKRKNSQRDMPEAVGYDFEEETVTSKRTHMLPPERRAGARLKIRDSKTKFDRERESSPDEEETSESGSSEEEEEEQQDEGVIEEEEVFPFDDTALPQIDDVLGNVGEEDDSYFAESYKPARRSSQGQTRKKKRRAPAESSLGGIDSRRIVPKTTSPRSIDNEEMGRTKDKSKKTKPMKSVYQRLGVSESHFKATQSFRKDSRRFYDQSPKERYDEPSPEPLMSASLSSNYRKSRTVSKVSSKRRWSGSGSGEEENHTLEQEPLSKNDKMQNSKKLKRKIKIATKSVRNLKESDSDVRLKIESNSTRLNIQDRIGKAIRNSAVQSAHQEEERGGRTDRKRKTRKEFRKGSGGTKRSREDVLEERIRRITEQNGLIKKRQREIELEKKKFGC